MVYSIYIFIVYHHIHVFVLPIQILVWHVIIVLEIDLPCEMCTVLRRKKNFISNEKEIIHVADATSKPQRSKKCQMENYVTHKLCKQSRWNLITSNAS